MKRCTKCLLPDTLPGSDFNTRGECHWCQTNFPPYTPKGSDSLRQVLESNRKQNSTADCMVGLSGGKDSTYALLSLIRDYNMKVEAFTYEHTGSTPFSLTNARRTCEILGIKHHIVSLPNRAHLKSFQAYFEAWLSNPSLVTAAMTCVACKHLHILGSDLAAKRKIPMIVWATSPYEYSPFLAIKYIPNQSKQFKREGMAKSGVQLAKELIKSPQFAIGMAKNLRTSALGCMAVFPTSGYLHRRFPAVKLVMFYEYTDWQPDDIKARLHSELEWSVPDTVEDDWHSDCMFNVFKEYMFQKMLGVSYTDAHLSNQIRHGIISRAEGEQKLRTSKMNFAKALIPAILEVGKKSWIEKIDLGCFDLGADL